MLRPVAAATWAVLAGPSASASQVTGAFLLSLRRASGVVSAGTPSWAGLPTAGSVGWSGPVGWAARE